MALVRPVLTAPGVYVQEVPSGVHTVVGVSTSVTAFIGRTTYGPVGEPTLITSFEDFERTFGGLKKDSLTTYAIQDFFLNGGTQAIVIRAFNDGGDGAMGRTGAVTFRAADPLALDNAQKAVDKATAKVTAAEDAKTAADKALKDAGSDSAKKKKAQAEQKTAEAALTKAQAELKTATDAQTALKAQHTDPQWKLVASSPGAWGGRVYYNVEDVTSPLVQARYKTPDWDATDLKNLTIYYVQETGGETVEHFPNVSTNAKAGHRSVSEVLKYTSRFARVLGAKDTAGTAKASDPLSPGDYEEALEALDKVDIFNLLCIPPDVREGDTAPDVYTEAVSLCEKRRATLIVDPPSAWGTSTPPENITPEDFSSDLGISAGATSARFAAVYFPRIIKPDPLNAGYPAQFCASGLIAGVYAKNDGARGVWKAPAGLDTGLLGVSKLEHKLTDAQNGFMNQRGINALRSFPDSGPVIWGARTMRGADSLSDDYKYVPVRRLADYIEESLKRGSKWAVFEPNDEPLWAQLRQSVGAFMFDLFRQGAFQGVTKDQAYFVKCDSSTTTQNDIDAGIVNVVVGFAPLKPAEFVILYFQQIAGNIQA